MDKNAFSKPNGTFFLNKNGKETFLPNMLPPAVSYPIQLVSLISEAGMNIGKLAGIGKLLPNPHVLIGPYLRQEAVLSSRIEGTEASISDLFFYEAVGKESVDAVFKRVREVRNYVAALNAGLRAVETGQPIDMSLLKKLHRILLTGVRGQDRNPGEFRSVQNWIGKTGKIQDATYVPPPPENLEKLLGNFAEFLSNPPNDMPVLVQCAVMHYQFEAVHPFADGNGRIGRLLITLLLCQKKVLPQPLLYPSAYFERNKTDYYSRLLSVSQRSEWEEWIAFFLNGVAAQAQEAIQNVERLLALKEHYDDVLRKSEATKNTHLLKDILFSNPYTTVKNATEYLNVSFVTAQKTIGILVDNGILEELSKQKRNRVFVAKGILHVLK